MVWGREKTWRGEHVVDGLGNHGGIFVDDEFEALGADQLNHVLLLHLLQFCFCLCRLPQDFSQYLYCVYRTCVRVRSWILINTKRHPKMINSGSVNLWRVLFFLKKKKWRVLLIDYIKKVLIFFFYIRK